MVLEKFSLEGKVAVVTGAAGFIGSCISQVLAKAGASVAVTDFRAEPLQETAESIKQLGRKSIALVADITDSRQVDRMIESAIAEFGEVNILMNVAGVVRGSERKPIEEITDNEWRMGIDVNLSGAFYFCRAVAKHFLARKSGKVVNFAAGSGLRSTRNNYIYCCAKSGVIQLTRTLALSWAQDNIQVNCIAPGFVGSPQIHARLVGTGGAGGQLIPMGRLGTPQDIASLALFLTSDASDYISGALFSCDGAGLAGGYSPTGYAPIIAIKED